MKPLNLTTTPLLVYILLSLGETADWMTYILITLVALIFIALLLYFHRSFQKAEARHDEWDYKKYSLLGPDRPEEEPEEEASDSPPPLAHEDARSSVNEILQELQPQPGTMSPLSLPPAQLTELMPLMEAHPEPLPPVEETSPRRGWGRRLTRIGIGVLVVLAAALWLVTKYPTGEHPPALNKPMASAAEKKGEDGANGVSDPLVRSTSQALEYNLITSSGNPLLTPPERTELITKALQGLRNPSTRQQMVHHHEALEQEMHQEGLSKEAWYAHVAACEQVCSPAFSALVSRHFAKVGEQMHTAVFFNLGDSSLDSTDRREIQHMADLLSTSAYADKRLLLVGRASKIGNHEANMALSEQRVKTVREALITSGVSPDRIKSFWLGWEQPYLTKELAERLHIPGELYGGDETKLNQSVMLVLY